MSRGWAYTRSESVGSESKVVFLARPFGRRGRPEVGWRPDRALRSERWAGAEKTGAVPSWPDLLVGDWITPPARRSGTWAGP